MTNHEPEFWRLDRDQQMVETGVRSNVLEIPSTNWKLMLVTKTHHVTKTGWTSFTKTNIKEVMCPFLVIHWIIRERDGLGWNGARWRYMKSTLILTENQIKHYKRRLLNNFRRNQNQIQTCLPYKYFIWIYLCIYNNKEDKYKYFYPSNDSDCLRNINKSGHKQLLQRHYWIGWS